MKEYARLFKEHISPALPGLRIFQSENTFSKLYQGFSNWFQWPPNLLMPLQGTTFSKHQGSNIWYISLVVFNTFIHYFSLMPPNPLKLMQTNMISQPVSWMLLYISVISDRVVLISLFRYSHVCVRWSTWPGGGVDFVGSVVAGSLHLPHSDRQAAELHVEGSGGGRHQKGAQHRWVNTRDESSADKLCC